MSWKDEIEEMRRNEEIVAVDLENRLKTRLKTEQEECAHIMEKLGVVDKLTGIRDEIWQDGKVTTRKETRGGDGCATVRLAVHWPVPDQYDPGGDVTQRECSIGVASHSLEVNIAKIKDGKFTVGVNAETTTPSTHSRDHTNPYVPPTPYPFPADREGVVKSFLFPSENAESELIDILARDCRSRKVPYLPMIKESIRNCIKFIKYYNLTGAKAVTFGIIAKPYLRRMNTED